MARAQAATPTRHSLRIAQGHKEGVFANPRGWTDGWRYSPELADVSTNDNRFNYPAIFRDKNNRLRVSFQGVVTPQTVSGAAAKANVFVSKP
jgi:hypothetical protein